VTARFVAVDWSGAIVGSERKIWLAEAAGGELQRLECGRTRAALTSHLVSSAVLEGRLIIGLDFAFAAPAWFMREQGCATAHEFWSLAASGEAERWLSECKAPFWGRALSTRPGECELLRQTESAVEQVAGARPKSIFQIAGPGAVGTGALRGMATLLELSRASFRVWPFDDPSPHSPLVFELYPRLCTGPVVKSSRDARVAYLEQHYPQLLPKMFDRAASSEDAFDAAVSALVMSEHARELYALAPVADPVLRYEGAIWIPDGSN
jgi:hypothetical protein